MMKPSFGFVFSIVLLCGPPVGARNLPTATEGASNDVPPQKQESAPMPHDSMNMSAMHGHLSSDESDSASTGTSSEPASTPSEMLMTRRLGWMLMFHGNVFVVDQQQSGPRGADKFFSVNWFMGIAQHSAGRGTFTVRSMISLEPATISGRQYPLLFQLGETAFGKPIVDGQHPHNFFMELAALYDWKLGEHTALSFYFAPVGDPAVGPTGFPHRASASENPAAPLGHHQEDSTHISDDVVTAGLNYRRLRIEASGFHGREPDELRWDIDHGGIDSWATRLTISPTKNWSGQVSYARIASIEELFPHEDQARTTASVMYNRPLARGNWANTLLWGRTNSLQDRSIFNSYLFESTLRFANKNNVWTRVENTDRSNELLLGPANPLPPNFVERAIGRLQAYTFGYDRELAAISHLSIALGAQTTTYGVPSALQPLYGAHPVGGMVFIRFRPR